MFLEVFSLYIKGLLLAIAFVFLVGIIWNFWRAVRVSWTKQSKNAKLFYMMC